MEEMITMSDHATVQVNQGNGDGTILSTYMGSSDDDSDSGSTTDENDYFGNETDSSTRNNEAPVIELVISVEQMLVGLPKPSQDYSIFRVPAKLRQSNEKAYTPQLVSIGPLHWGKPELIGMEAYKMRYLKAFLERTAMTTEKCLRLIQGLENEVRGRYAESIGLSSDDFVKMILVDSGFIIESLLRYSSGEDDERGVFHFLRSDLMLVENQLPFFVLDRIFDLAFTRYPLNRTQRFPPLLELSVVYFKTALLVNGDPDPSEISVTEVKHLVDLVRMVHLPSSRSYQEYVRIQTATALHATGMKFKCGTNKGFLEMKFISGELQIPRFRLNNYADHLLRNLIALEVYFYQDDSYILDCAIFMDELISGGKDVDILVKNGIIENYIGESEAVADMFNKLTSQYLFNNYCFGDVSERMNLFYQAPLNKWKATLKREYCSSPFKIASVVAAFILLVLTLTQTVGSIVGLSKNDPKIALWVSAVAFGGIVFIVMVGMLCRLLLKRWWRSS